MLVCAYIILIQFLVTRLLLPPSEDFCHPLITFANSLNPDQAPALKVIIIVSCSNQLSKEIQVLIKTKIPTNKEASCYKSLRCCAYHANKCYNANNCWHFNIYEQDKFPTQLS